MDIHGFVDPQYEAVRDAFRANFEAHGEVGAAFAAYRNGEPVVDLWAGLADEATGRAWERDTLQLIFSGTKGLVAASVLILIERELVSLDRPVSDYWPEFGKREILVRHIVSHQARLPGIDETIGIADLIDDRTMAARLAAQSPSDDPRAANCYHPLTYGWLCGELIRRVTGASVGAFFASEIASPLDLDIWIGLPARLDDRVSRFKLGEDWASGNNSNPETFARDPLIRSIWGNPPHFLRDHFPWDQTAFHRAEIPGASAIATARSVAKFYGALATGGAPIISRATLEAGLKPLRDGFDIIHDAPARNGVGFQLQTELMNLGPPSDAFGHNGAGGSTHGAWPSLGIGFSYAMNLLIEDRTRDPRARTLLQALYESAASG